MTDAVLVVNAGSSSVKFSVVRRGRRRACACAARCRRSATPRRASRRATATASSLERSGACPPAADHATAIAHVAGRAGVALARRAAGRGRPSRRARRRASRGAGDRRRAACSANSPRWCRSRRCISRTTSRRSQAVARLAPTLPQVACFDTAFHRTQPTCAQLFALPPRDHRARACCATASTGCRTNTSPARSPRVDPAAARRPHDRRAPRQRRVDVRDAGRTQRRDHHGLHAARRPRDGHARRQPRSRRACCTCSARSAMDRDDVERLLYHRSGLLGDVRASRPTCARCSPRDDPRAAQAVELFCYRAVREIGSLAAALGGTRRAGVHRRHRRERGAGARAHPAAARVARRRRRRGRERAHGPRITTAGQPGRRVRDPHRRGAHDPAPHARAARPRRRGAGVPSTVGRTR